jgi:L-iditol 2-dehydrogenase
MRAARLYGKEDLRVEDIPVPRIGAGEVLLRVKAAAVCGTDIRMFRNGARGATPESPLVLGHEVSGVVEEAGEGVSGYSKGMPVAVAPNMGCGVCDQCVSGNTQMCPTFKAFGINLPGGFAPYMKIPATLPRCPRARISSPLPS